MTRRTVLIFAAIALCSLLLFALIPHAADSILEAAALPFTLAGQGLRLLSLAGGAGNLAAILLYAAICLSPLLLLLRKSRSREDWLLLPLSAGLFGVLYLMINPGLMPENLSGTAGTLIFCGMVYSLLLTWGILKLLRRAQTMDVYTSLRLLLTGCAVLWIVMGFGVGFGNFRTDVARIQAGNTMDGINLLPTFLFRFLVYATTALEYTLDAALMLLGAALLRELEADPYSERCLASAAKISGLCRRFLAVIVLNALAVNVGQILCAPILYDIDISVRVPVFSAALVFGAMALTQLLAQGKELKEDNDLFI